MLSATDVLLIVNEKNEILLPSKYKNFF